MKTKCFFRLTGAGWGGCTVALVPEDKLESYVEGMKRDYFKDLEAAKGLDEDAYIFPTQPGSGAAIYDA